MKKLDLRMWRDLWRMRWRALAIILTLASSVAVYVGVNLGVQSLYWTRDTTFERLHFADLEVRFVPEEAGNLPELSDLEGVERIERRLVFPAVVRRPGNEPMMAVMTLLRWSISCAW